MADDTELPAAFLRALQGLADGSGRTVVIAGPEESGKSALLTALTERLQRAEVRVRPLRATYADRTTPYDAVRPLALGEGAPEGDAEPEDGAAAEAFAFLPPESGGRRRGRGERQRGRVLGVTYTSRSRGVERVDEVDYWNRLCEGFAKEPDHRVAITLEDGTFADDASRAFLLYLSARARFRPLVLALVLDSSDPGFAAWEEQLVGRPDVDWVRLPASRLDPREANRVKRAVDGLPTATRRVVFLTALLGGSTSEVQLSRVARLTFQELGDALLPATEGRLVRVEAGRVVIPHPAWLHYLPELLGAAELRRLHREIAEALEAMHPEPTLVRRRELAQHQFAADPGPVALRYLLESAELSEQLYAFDAVDGLLTLALTCVPSLPIADRPAAEAELRLFRARCLLFAGRAGEAERELIEGLDVALRHSLEWGRLEEWVEPIVPGLQAVGPRPSLVTSLVEIVERLHGRGAGVLEAMFQLIISESEFLRGRVDRGRHESHRAGYLARRQPTAPIEALALLAVGHARAGGTSRDRDRADRFLRSAGVSFTSLRRPELEQMALEYRSRLLVASDKPQAAVELHQRAIPMLVRLHLPSLELSHQLGLAESWMEARPDPRALRALKRARELAELLHLTPPAPALVRLWLLEGRRAGFADDPAGARDCWSALVDRSGPPVLEPLRAEAMLRLAALEELHGRPEVSEALYGRTDLRGTFGASPPDWATWSERIRALGPRAASGAASLALLTERGGD